MKDKTGGPFARRWPLAASQPASTRGGAADDDDAEPTLEQCYPLLDTMSLYFQIRDDYLNLAGGGAQPARKARATRCASSSSAPHDARPSQVQAHKSFCEDITEGKFSFPISARRRASGLRAARQERADERAPQPSQSTAYARAPTTRAC